MTNWPLRFSLSLSTIAVLAAVAIVVPCAAQDSHSGSPEAAGDKKPAGDTHSSPPAKKVSGEAEKESRAPAAESAEPVDARIAPSPSHGGHDHATHVRPIGVASPRNLLTRQRPAVAVPMPTTRNTIGVALQHRNTGVAPPGSVAPLNFGRRTGSAAVKPVAVNNGALNGTGLARHASAPAAIGGPAPAAGGISGSSIRPKHTTRP